MPQTLRLVICAEHFSPNLGDGVLGDGLAHILTTLRPGAHIARLDLSGRTAIPPQAKSSALKGWLQTLPGVRRALFLAQWHLKGGKKTFTTRLTNALKKADALLIGGGQLVMDNDGYFPLRLAAAIKIAAQAEVPVAYALVGVGSAAWGGAGAQRLRFALAHPVVRSISVRDEASAKRLKQFLKGSAHAPILVGADPALAVRAAYNLPPRKAPARGVGLGLMAPHQLGKGHLTRSGLKAFWVGLIQNLLAARQHVTLFTNGLPGDEAFVTAVLRALPPEIRQKVQRQPRLTDPARFVKLLDGFGAVAAFRLHACITATALGKPVLALGWDDKLRAFMQATGQEKNFLKPENLEADRAAELILAAKPAAPSLVQKQRVAAAAALEATLKKLGL